MTATTNNQKEYTNGFTSDFTNKVKDSALELNKMVYDSTEKIEGMAADIVDSAIDSTVDFTTDSIGAGLNYIKKNPYKSLAIAVTSGLAAGIIFSYYMKNSKN